MQIIKNKFASPSVLYNQFSIAGSDGIKAHLMSDAASVLDKMVEHHKCLGATMTIPFASFVRFAREDNKYMNEFANTALDAKKHFHKNDIQLVLQAINGDYIEWEDVAKDAANKLEVDAQGKAFFTNQTRDADDQHEYNSLNPLEVKKAIEGRIGEWRKVTSKIALRFLKLDCLNFRITDWEDEIWKIDFENNSFSKVSSSDFDISIASQPLFQAFQLPFGIQTLGVSGRYSFSDRFDDVPTTWKKVRVLSSLYNAEIYLNPKSIFSSQFMGWVWSRRKGQIAQIFQQFKRFR